MSRAELIELMLDSCLSVTAPASVRRATHLNIVAALDALVAAGYPPMPVEAVEPMINAVCWTDDPAAVWDVMAHRWKQEAGL